MQSEGSCGLVLGVSDGVLGGSGVPSEVGGGSRDKGGDDPFSEV